MKQCKSKSSVPVGPIEAAYNIAEEKKLAAAENFPAREVFCRRYHQMIFSIAAREPCSHPMNEPFTLAGEWQKEAKLVVDPCFGRITHRSTCVKCVVYHAGDKWRIWKPEEVWRKFSLSEPMPLFATFSGRHRGNRGNHASRASPSGDRCLRICGLLLLEIASLFIEAKAAFSGFESAFISPGNERAKPSPEIFLALALHGARNAVFDIVKNVLAEKRFTHTRKDLNVSAQGRKVRVTDGVWMLGEGLKIAELIAEARAIVLSQGYAKTVARRQTTRIRAETKFWVWICTNPAFQGITAKKLFELLHNIGLLPKSLKYA